MAERQNHRVLAEEAALSAQEGNSTEALPAIAYAILELAHKVGQLGERLDRR